MERDEERSQATGTRRGRRSRPSSAMAATLRLLARRDHFRDELAERLLGMGYQDDEVAAALARCTELGYLDDGALARRFVELRAVDRGWGPHRLAAELRRRGVSPELAEVASRVDSAVLAQALDTAIRRLERRAREGWWRLHDRRARMVSSLVSRGFETDDAYRAVAEVAAQREKQHHARDDQPGDPLRLP